MNDSFYALSPSTDLSSIYRYIYVTSTSVTDIIFVVQMGNLYKFYDYVLLNVSFASKSESSKLLWCRLYG